jgi:threonine aldolase
MASAVRSMARSQVSSMCWARAGALPMNIWQPRRSLARLMTSWDTEADEVDDFVARLGAALAAGPTG